VMRIRILAGEKLHSAGKIRDHTGKVLKNEKWSGPNLFPYLG